MHVDRQLLEDKAVQVRGLVTGGGATHGAVLRAWRPHLAAGGMAAAALLAPRRRTRPLAAVLGALGALAAAPVARRLVRRTQRVDAAPRQEGGSATDITILVGNVRHGRADTGALTDLLARELPDFVVLPEAGERFRTRLMSSASGLGYRSWTASGGVARDGKDVTLLVGERAGAVLVRPGSGMRLPHLEVTGGILGSHSLYAVHTSAPMSAYGTRWWRAELDLIGQWLSGPVGGIVVGDLNATLDHPELVAAIGEGRCAAEGTGRGLIGTYPAGAPRWMGIQIDHVLLPVDGHTVGFAVRDLLGSDHRAVLAAVRVPFARSATDAAADGRDQVPDGSAVAL